MIRHAERDGYFKSGLETKTATTRRAEEGPWNTL